MVIIYLAIFLLIFAVAGLQDDGKSVLIWLEGSSAFSYIPIIEANMGSMIYLGGDEVLFGELRLIYSQVEWFEGELGEGEGKFHLIY